MTGDRDIDDLLSALSARDLGPAALDDLARRLTGQPDTLTHVTDDLPIRKRLCGPVDGVSAPPDALRRAAERLQRRLAWRTRRRQAAPWAAALVLFAAGWAGPGLLQTAPAPVVPPMVSAALNAQVALDLRQWMQSQPEVPQVDATEVAAALGVELPDLPPDWEVLDAQIVPTPDRPGLALALRSPELGRFLMFTTARPAGDVLDPPRSFEVGGSAVAVFEQGAGAFVFVDVAGHPDQLTRSAGEMMRHTN